VKSALFPDQPSLASLHWNALILSTHDMIFREVQSHNHLRTAHVLNLFQ